MSGKSPKISKTPTRVDCTAKMSIPDGFLGNLLMTLIDLVRANSKKAQQVNPSPFKSAQVPWTYFFIFT